METAQVFSTCFPSAWKQITMMEMLVNGIGSNWYVNSTQFGAIRSLLPIWIYVGSLSVADPYVCQTTEVMSRSPK